jgi:hypothetical protein
LPERDFYLSNVLNYLQKAKYLVIRRASLHGNILARQSDLVVPGKRTVLSVEPCTNFTVASTHVTHSQLFTMLQNPVNSGWLDWLGYFEHTLDVSISTSIGSLHG